MSDEHRPLSLWRFDAWDSRAGLAFASYRPADNYAEDDLKLDTPTVFIGPPDFQPEQLESRAIALAASRGSFQHGLFSKDRELGFGELTELIEEVRRAYVAGSVLDHGDDGGGGNTQSVPIIPPDGGLEGGDASDFLSSSEPTDLREEVEDLLVQFRSRIEELGRSQEIDEIGKVPSARFAWPAFLKAKPATGDDIVEQGGLRIVWELLRRYQRDGYSPDYYQWTEASGRLVRACIMLQLWRSWRSHGHLISLLKSAQPLLRKLSHTSRAIEVMLKSAFEGTEGADAWLLLWLLVPEDRAQLEGELDIYDPYRARPLFMMNDYWSDMPMRDLGFWPIPQKLGTLANPNYPRRASVADLLATFLACPQKFHDFRRLELWQALEICLFAAAYLTHRDSPVPITVATDERAPWRPRNFEFHEPAMALRKAWRWLSEQLPKVAFMPEVEEMIFQTRMLSYRSGTVAEPLAYA